MSVTNIVSDGDLQTSHHPLTSSWTLFYHDPEDPNWSDGSYVKVCEIRSIEEFWSLYQLLPKHTFHLGMFFLMRDTIFPTWEDPQNRNGGCWSYKVPIADVFSAWESLSVYLVSENLTPSDFKLINGISISPKKGFCIIKIWNNNSCKNNHTLLSSHIQKLNHSESLYTVFKDK